LAQACTGTMPFGFYLIMAAQFFSSLADNALLVAAIALLIHMQTPEWMTPLLKFFFTVSYVLFAAFVGAFADSMPKGRVMFITNLVKIIGCLTMFFHEFITFSDMPGWLVVLLAYSIVGLGAAAYSPAKYGILTELLPHHRLVIANGWI
jgi:LPLT family lysophospholipid transporter-like MFS transporter